MQVLYILSVSVALVIQYLMRVRRITVKPA